jgi:enoyl-CoA hydratase
MAPAFWSDFPATIVALGDDPDVRCLVVAARGPAFTVGLDLAAFGPRLAEGGLGGTAGGSGAASRIATYHEIKRMQRTFSSLAECPVPVIAAVHGWCLGAGIDLITACDIRLAAADAVFSVRETRMGMVADVGTLQRLPAIIGGGRVAELVYTGRDVTAAEAETMNLVNRVLPDHEALMAAAFEVAGEIAANSPLAVRGAKAVLSAATRASTAEALDHVALWNAAFLHSDDLTEAIRAFAEGRPPDYTGT